MILARHGHDVHAIDSSAQMARLTGERADREGLGHQVHAATGDAHSLDFDDRAFDLVVAVGVIPWLHDPARALMEMARVLVPGGGLVLTADNRARLNVMTEPRGHPLLTPVLEVRRAWRRRHSPAEPGAISRQHSRRQVDALLAQAGLKPLGGSTVGYGPFTFMGRPVFGEATALRVEKRLSALALRGVPGLDRTGWHHVVGARAPKQPAPVSSR